MQRPGFFGGMRIFFQGFGFVISRPSVWPYAMVPVIAALVLGGALSAVGIWGAHRLVDALFGSVDGTLETVGFWTARILLYVVAVVTALFLGAMLAQPLSGPALDAIVRAVEKASGRPPSADAPFWESVGRAVRVTLFTLALAIPILGVLTVVEFLVPPLVVVTWPLKLCLTAHMAAWNMLDYPFGLRRMGVRDRHVFYRANMAQCFGFGVLLALLGLVPFIGLLVLPVGVAGATKLWIGAGDRGD
jgi:CysZ protein